MKKPQLQNKKTGSHGETLASNYLQQQGYEILFRNYTLRWGEIDIIARKSSTLVFVEVKARQSTLKGSPYEAITYFKMKHLLRSAQYFLKQHPYPDYLYRFDVISILYSEGEEPELKHYENITQ